MTPTPHHYPTIAEIQKAVAQHFGVSVIDLKSERRSGDVVRPRQIAMWLAKKYTGTSLPTIGIHFGRRDHTTVLHAVRLIKTMVLENSYLSKWDEYISDAVADIEHGLRTVDDFDEDDRAFLIARGFFPGAAA